VLLGDIYQCDHGPLLGQRFESAELQKAERRLPSLRERFRRYDYIAGNHDAVAAPRSGALPDLRIEADGFVVYFIHGHQFDPLLRRLEPIARASTWISGRVRRAGLRPIADWLEARDVAIKDTKFRSPTGPYNRGARALLREQGAHAVIMGHTHVLHVTKLEAGIHGNTGTCSQGRLMGLTIDTEQRTVRPLPDTVA